MKTIAIIPARYRSSRYPGKPLVKILGIPLIIWVSKLVVQALGKENVYVATEDKRILQVVHKYGFQGIMTSDTALTGTDRLYEASQQIDADIYINVQGDEPLINPDDILKVLSYKKENPGFVVNGMCPLDANDNPENRNIPKVVFNENQQLVYMSRLPIPGSKSKDNPLQKYWKQVCIYAFSKEELNAYGQYGRKSLLEECEDIEILRFLEMNIPVKMVETSGSSYAVDVPEDVMKVEQALRKVHGL